MFFIDHLYFSWGLFIFVVLWLPLFILNKKGRKWMLYMSLFGAVMGALPIVQNMYLADWWQPNFIFDFPVNIEDILFGLGTVGVISSIYSILKTQDKRLTYTKISSGYTIAAILSAFSAFFGLFYVFHIHSLWSSVIGVCTGVIFIAVKKPYFLKPAIKTGLLVCLLFLPMYVLALYINPDYINNEWLLHELSGITFASIPIEEFIWYFFAALGVTALQELFVCSELALSKL